MKKVTPKTVATKRLKQDDVKTSEQYDVKNIKDMITAKIVNHLGEDVEHAGDDLYYKASALVITDILKEKRQRFMADVNFKGKKQVYYLSIEYLLGRSLKNGIYNLELVDQFQIALEEMGVKLGKLYEFEPDAGLGNGGLGRLAACFLDALATIELPATGYSILYEYGIFKQQIVNGWQKELPDYWLPGGEVWLTPHPDHQVEIHFGGEIEEYWAEDYHHLVHKNTTTVIALPYDMHISGYNSKGVSLLRLWEAKSPGFDMDSFLKGDYTNASGRKTWAEAVSKVLYPDDSHPEGKNLRLRQQYFLVAASMSDIIRRHMAVYGTLENFAEKNAVHINDTHPVLAIPELMRILLDTCGYDWKKSWNIVSRTFAYTNHTVMSEALERWNEDMFKTLLPRIHQIIVEINERFCKDLFLKQHVNTETVSKMSIIAYHEIRMANLAVAVSHSVNGVSALHSQIIKDDLFNDFYRLTPKKFKSVTNGIASRRWLYQSNPGLTKLCKEVIGEDFLNNLNSLEKLNKYVDDKAFLKRLSDVKRENKEEFANYVFRTTGVKLNLDSIFDVQVKRLHEYKRQHLNALHILSLYQQIKANPAIDMVPRTFIFGAKAAPGYYMAKQIIKFICTLRDVIEADPDVKDLLKIVYLEDYKVTVSEILMPASEISEQISLAGTEASGTGNMKLMLNGAITIGTLDGANVEIIDAAGEENAFIFGMTTPEVVQTKKEGYNPYSFYENNVIIRAAVDQMERGLGDMSFPDIVNSLKYSDPYMVLKDFDSYAQAQDEVAKCYMNELEWQKKSLYNIAGSGIFCADRAMHDYARTIWKMEK